MKVRLSKSVMLGFHMSHMALHKLFGAKEVIWEQLDIHDEDMQLPEGPEDRLLYFTGIVHGVFTTHYYKTMVVVRITKDDDGYWNTKYVDIHCHHPDTGKVGEDGEVQVFETDVEPFTQYLCGDLEEGLPIRTAA